MNHLKLSLIILLFLIFQAKLSAQKEKSYIRQGTKEYSNNKYGNAEVSYQKATTLNPESFEAKFNLGDALYKQEKYDEAIAKFSELSYGQADQQKLASLYHNIGNSHLNKTSKLLNEQKFDDAIKQLDKSIDAYKTALRNNPSDRETKYNLLYAKELKKMLEEQKQKQENKDKNKQEKDDKGDQKDDQNKQDKDKGDPAKDNQDQEGDSDSQDENDEQKKPEQKTEVISKEDAMRLLNAIENDEKDVQEKLKKIKGSRVKKQEKDW